MLKNKKGITLVALIVTIIILLILAGVSISQLTESGLFNKAREAEQKYENAERKENTTLLEYENAIEAIGKGKQYYYIILSPNNGTGEQQKLKVEIDSTINLPENKFVMSGGYSFAGWATEANGKVIYTDKQEIKNLAGNNETITLYARYKHTHGSECYEIASEYTPLTWTNKSVTTQFYNYNAFSDETCTLLVSNQFLLRIVEGTANYPLKVISSGVTYYLDGTYNSCRTNYSGGPTYGCENCGVAVLSSGSYTAYHKCTIKICELTTTLK